jgi:hypothetical protein
LRLLMEQHGRPLARETYKCIFMDGTRT